MHHKLSVLVQVDLDGRTVRLVVTGCLTELNHRALAPLLRRARGLVPGIRVSVDLAAAHHVEAAAVDLLRWTSEHEEAVRGTPPVAFVLPEELPVHGTVTRLAARRAGTPVPGRPAGPSGARRARGTVPYRPDLPLAPEDRDAGPAARLAG
ncbi:hypothetical protein AUQ48_00565 [Kocuria flava]|uniref:STAS domain-containing protein n=1 Tax=Kocuria flava TaxID=446860 RepID=A0A2N4SYK5_9MICC|nr:hypothetical protein [Kocuria flava]PLC11019.1 hypothetical protein AUQ48_00565 [Kocuria flava]